MERVMHLTTLITGDTLRFKRTRITRGSLGTVLCLLPGILHTSKVQQLAVWTDIAIMLGIIAKLSGSEIGPLVFPIRQGNVGPDVCVLHGFDVLDGAVLRVARHVARLEFPAKAGAKDEVEQQLAFRTNSFKEHYQLQLEEDDRINGRTPLAGIGLLDKFAHKRQIKRSFQMSIEVVLRNQLFQSNIDEWSKETLFLSHHSSRLPLLHDKILPSSLSLSLVA
jgi:hypothetical protein